MTLPGRNALGLYTHVFCKGSQSSAMNNANPCSAMSIPWKTDYPSLVGALVANIQSVRIAYLQRNDGGTDVTIRDLQEITTQPFEAVKD